MLRSRFSLVTIVSVAVEVSLSPSDWWISGGSLIRDFQLTFKQLLHGVIFLSAAANSGSKLYTMSPESLSSLQHNKPPHPPPPPPQCCSPCGSFTQLKMTF